MTTRRRIVSVGSFTVTLTVFAFACIGSEPAVILDNSNNNADGTATTETSSQDTGAVPSTNDSASTDSSTGSDADGSVVGDTSIPTDGGGTTDASALGSPVAWFAGDHDLTTDGGSVMWRDFSGNGHHLVSAGAVPNVVTTDGKGSVQFVTPASGVSCLQVSGLVLPAARSMYAVALLTRWFTGGTNYESTLLFMSGNAASLGTVILAGPSPRWASGNVQYGYNVSAIGDINVRKIFAVRDNGVSNLELTVSSNDGYKADASVVGSYAGSATGGVVNVGCRPSDNHYQWDGIVSEVILYDRRLTDTEHQATIEYLKTKWAVVFP